MNSVKEGRPLAERLRPQSLDDLIGQEHLIGKGAVLREGIEKGILPSIILWGPPGVGKTTMAAVIAETLDRPFQTLSAVSSGVKDVREVIEKVRDQGLFGGHNAILFIDEIHRFSKAQQDSLLSAVEKGTITLIGATTENPSFEVISPLLSRCQVYTLEALGKEELLKLLQRAIDEDPLIGQRELRIDSSDALLRLSGGDARKLLNIFELVVHNSEEDPVVINDERVREVVQENPLHYDKEGEQHYDITSAFIKSMRGSDPQAAVYWLARMVEGGEDPLFIARRMVILASEDIGLADPNALLMANATFDAVERIGMPEGRIPLSQCAIYLASAPKSNAAYEAINAAQAKVKESGDLQVPHHLRNAPTQLMKELGYSEGYRYAHSYDEHFTEQEFLPSEISGTKFYEPASNKREEKIREELKRKWGERYDH